MLLPTGRSLDIPSTIPLVMLKLVKSHFYREPEFEETDAPAKQPLRAIDLFVGDSGTVTYNHITITSATRFKHAIDHSLLDEKSNVFTNRSNVEFAKKPIGAGSELRRSFIPRQNIVRNSFNKPSPVDSETVIFNTKFSASKATVLNDTP